MSLRVKAYLQMIFFKKKRKENKSKVLLIHCWGRVRGQVKHRDLLEMNGSGLQWGIFPEFPFTLHDQFSNSSSATKGEPRLLVQRERGFELTNLGLLTKEATTLALIHFT